MVTPTFTSGRFDIGRVVRLTFSVIGANLGVFAGLGVILAGIPYLALIALVYLGVFVGFKPVWPLSLLVGFAAAIGAIAIYFILQGSIIFGVVAHLNSRKATLGECLAKGAQHWFPLLLMSIVVGIAEVFGFALLVVPGIMLAMAWFVAVPVQVIESRDVMQSLSRSADLTRGRRWSIFGLAVAYVVANIIVQKLLETLFGGVASAPGGAAVGWISSILSVLISFAGFVIVSAGAGVVYYELRSTREGVSVEALASVFD